MVNQPIAKLTFREARELAHLASVFQDLGFVVQASKRLASLLEAGSTDPILERSLFTAALVAYVRCFSSGKRTGLSTEIYGELLGEPLLCHQQYKDTRDKHIAHSVNPFEEMLVGAVLSPLEGEVRQVEGVACLTATLITWDIAGVEQLGRLAQFAQSYVGTRCKELEASVLEIAKGHDIEALYSSTGLRFTAQGGAVAAASPRDA